MAVAPTVEAPRGSEHSFASESDIVIENGNVDLKDIPDTETDSNGVADRPVEVPEDRRPEEELLHLAVLAIEDLVLIGAAIELISIKLEALTKLVSEILIDKGDVIANLAHFENFLAPEAQLFVPLALLDHIVAFIVLFTERAAIPAIFDVAQKLDAVHLRHRQIEDQIIVQDPTPPHEIAQFLSQHGIRTETTVRARDSV